MDEVILQNGNNIKILLLPNLRKKNWDDKELKEKKKQRYYKEVINPNLENQNYIFILTSVKKRMNTTKLRANRHELHS